MEYFRIHLMGEEFSNIHIGAEQASSIAFDLYKIEGSVTPLPGELDFNFKIITAQGNFLLKVSRPGTDEKYLEFQHKILQHLASEGNNVVSPVPQADRKGEFISEIKDSSGKSRKVRLLSWLEGRLWSGVNPVTQSLLSSLGEQAGRVTAALADFNHPQAGRESEWDLAQARWTREFEYLFEEEQREIIIHFREKYDLIQPEYSVLRKSLVHADANDNNLVIAGPLDHPQVHALIDYGDAIHTQVINDVAITMAYAVMNLPDPLSAALPLLQAYHGTFPLKEKELELLHCLVAMRLIISVTKSAINRLNEPDNEYLLISEAPAWDLLKKWRAINPEFAHYSFRSACFFSGHPHERSFATWACKQSPSLSELFPALERDRVQHIDLGVSSTWNGTMEEAADLSLFQYKMDRLQEEAGDRIIAGGYLEPRALYTSEAYDRMGNSGRESRTVHLGIDFWVPCGTQVHALFDGEVVTAVNNAGEKLYGGLVILKHHAESMTFYSLHGHLSVESALKNKAGDRLNKGDLVGIIGNYPENGKWSPHLHFQLMLSLLGYENDFPGVAYAGQLQVWKSICPDPNLLFRKPELEGKDPEDIPLTLQYRKEHLGKSLSLSYAKPLKMVRGDGAYLINHMGRRFLDTVNNVAHVGHEHPRVVRAGQKQMAVLNTNTRYLHDNINEFTKELLLTFPPELSVVHLVNSGSEANELALRMAQTITGHKDMIAVEVGYHGNTSGCVNVSSYKFDGKGGRGKPEHTHIVPLPDRFRGIYRGDRTGPLYASHIGEQIKHIHASGRGLAGFICESIISCGGQIEPPDQYLSMAFASVREAGGICIADEVQVGCGRVGTHFWGFQLHGVIPDIVTIGKPIGNGHPLAAVVCTREVADAFANGMEYFNTFGGNPVSCAIGTEVLRVVREESLQENALKTGNYLKEALKKMQAEFPVIGDVRGQGLFLGIELNDEELKPQTERAAYLSNRMRDLGILMSTDGKDVNVLKIKPPLVFTKKHADELLGTLERVFREDFMYL